MTTAIRLAKQREPASTGAPTVPLRRVEPAEPVRRAEPVESIGPIGSVGPIGIDAIVEGAELAVGSQRVDLGGRATVALAPVEVEAVLRAAEAASTHPDPQTMATVANIRLARGSASMPPTEVHARGPRRARETLRADRIKSAGALEPPSRKR